MRPTFAAATTALPTATTSLGGAGGGPPLIARRPLRDRGSAPRGGVGADMSPRPPDQRFSLAQPTNVAILGHRRAEPGDDVVELEGDRLFELLVGARARLAVGPPPCELGGVPEPRALHVVVTHLDHPFRSQRHEGQILAGVPP